MDICTETPGGTLTVVVSMCTVNKELSDGLLSHNHDTPLLVRFTATVTVTVAVTFTATVAVTATFTFTFTATVSVTRTLCVTKHFVGQARNKI